jgi:hypothetical protein
MIPSMNMVGSKLIRSFTASVLHCVHNHGMDGCSSVQVPGYVINIDISLSKYEETVTRSRHCAFHPYSNRKSPSLSRDASMTVGMVDMQSGISFSL